MAVPGLHRGSHRQQAKKCRDYNPGRVPVRLNNVRSRPETAVNDRQNDAASAVYGFTLDRHAAACLASSCQ